MSPRAWKALLLAQTLVVVLLAWGLVVLGRDEFQFLAEREEEEVPTANRLEAGEGQLPQVRLSAQDRQQIGLRLAAAQAGRLAAAGEWSAQVLDVQPLLAQHAQLRAATHALAQAQAQAQASTAEARRAKALFDDDRLGSQRAMEQAQAQAAADDVGVRSAHDALRAAQAAVQAAWGREAAQWAVAADPAPLQRLATGAEVLLRAVPGAGAATPPPSLQWQAAGDAAPRTARLVGALPAGEAGTGRAAWVYRAPGAGLAPGARLALRADASGQGVPGAWLPEGALLWHAGQAWVYAPVAGPAASAAVPAAPAPPAAARKARDEDDKDEEDDDKPAAPPAAATSPAAAGPVPPPAPEALAFQRRALPNARRVDGRWFVPGFDPATPVVVEGAQLLLSEELKFQIRNENDD